MTGRSLTYSLITTVMLTLEFLNSMTTIFKFLWVFFSEKKNYKVFYIIYITTYLFHFHMFT